MSAEIIPFARSVDEAWQAYCDLLDEAQASATLIDDPAHKARRAAAHRVFKALFARDLGDTPKASIL